MFVLDTNVASELMRPAPASKVAAWIGELDAEALFLTAVTEAELLYGVAIVPPGRRRDTLEAALTRWLDLGFGERILPFDSAAARDYAEIAAKRRRAGRPVGRSARPIARLPPYPARAVLSWSRGTCVTSRAWVSKSSIPGRQGRHDVGNRPHTSVPYIRRLLPR